jgi:XTP/dITP diphosphohydrolase
MQQIVFATHNLHKLEEARRIMGNRLRILGLADIGCHEEIEETADTLEGNAIIKAKWVVEHYGYACFADDTGLIVDCLNGAPGVLSARYAGEHCSPDDNMTLLLRNLNGKQDRTAHFSTVIAYMDKDGELKLFEGRVDGEIAEERHGSHGFGYDPIFIAKESGVSFAEMSAEDKNAISHRGRAMRKFIDYLLNK